ncbi:hypothetical protein GTHT12_02569 [Geobacillus thermodenitrificans]|jgi:hypothetical protein|nr:hypothetical protein GTHT12_02569 [Geobacillus thermodenitrificans]KQB92001.1 hypothetical protein GEPA3_3140 [Geobacillus sp. PA-3]MEC5187857.1 hypothetical protein [Geobacillus thermodenitrificans]
MAIPCCWRSYSFIAIANKGSEGNLGLKTEKAVMMKRGMFAVVREYI